MPRHRFHDRYDNGIAELAIRLGIGNRNLEGFAPLSVETHKTSALARCQPPGTAIARLANEDL